VNIGNPDEITVLQLAEDILRLTDSPSKIVYQERPVDDPTQRKPDISLAKRLLDWEPMVDREQGLLDTIAYFKTLQ
jgi:dTDP-glucose 4,6-dehydratase